MHSAAVVLIGLVALLHFYFLILEMFLWTKPSGMRAFRLDKATAEQTKVLAANQGLYNGFLSIGLVWSLFDTRPEVAQSVAVFFLTCVVIAGFYGAYSTKNKKILFIQSAPAIVALALVVGGR